MESIYKLMNAINDKESLNEKYNVKNIQGIMKLKEDYFEDVDNDNSIMSDYGFEEGENDMNDLYFYKEDSDDVVVTVHGNDAVKGVKCPDAGTVIKRPTKVTLADGDEETVLGVIDAEYEVSSFADYYVLNDSRIEDKVWKTLNNYLNSQREAQTDYEQMNKIDDEESLDEKYNVKNTKQLKMLKEAGPRITVDSEGLRKNLPIVIKKIISELPYEITSHKLSGSIERATRPVRYNFNGTLHLTLGENAKASHPVYDDKGVDVWLTLYSLPTNCELTVDLLEEMYREDIVEDISRYVKSTDSVKTNETQYRAVEKEFLDAIKPLESKYNVTLSPSLYPKVEEFSREGGHITDYVHITSVSGKLGQMKKQDSGYYEYEINGVSYSTYLRYNEHNVSPCKYTDIKDFDANWVAQETSKRIEDLLKSIDTLDNLVKREPAAEKQMAEYVSSLQSKYKDAKIEFKRDGWFKPQVFVVTYEEDGNQWELDISLEDVVNSFDKVKSQIQRKIYRTKKPAKPSYSSDVRTQLNFDED